MGQPSLFKNMGLYLFYVFIQVASLCSIVDGQLKLVEGELSKGMLENNTCYFLDCGAEVFVWVGRVTQVDERKAAIQAAEVECRGLCHN